MALAANSFPLKLGPESAKKMSPFFSFLVSVSTEGYCWKSSYNCSVFKAKCLSKNKELGLTGLKGLQGNDNCCRERFQQ